jgi:hypothetical protein
VNREQRRAARRKGITDDDLTSILGDEPPKVTLSYIHPGDVSAAFMASVFGCMMYELARTGRNFGMREKRSRTLALPKNRNLLTAAFLETDADWLWFVDADMGFPPDALHKLLVAADAETRPIVGGLCFAQRYSGFEPETNADIYDSVPTLHVYSYTDGQWDGFKTIVLYPRDALVKVDSTGAAFLLIHRTALEKIRDTEVVLPDGTKSAGKNWWTQVVHPTADHLVGEDTSFFYRAHQCGIPLHVHTGIRTSHDKGGVFLTEQLWDLQQALKPEPVE